VRVKECEAQTLRLRGRIFFDPAFDPYASVRDESSSPFFFADTPPAVAPPPFPTRNESHAHYLYR
jgi:hypothetical protein